MISDESSYDISRLLTVSVFQRVGTMGFGRAMFKVFVVARSNLSALATPSQSARLVDNLEQPVPTT
ncbi:hypothetical protein K0M31_003237 [Melipona bicolor]|uniref:Uncharacterized protein n=1 Tax=Melipona bicolor TaxID=60889 RepID=A0AA40KP99_9HYME|nr:hypothetical protein K0M31_003237 [Melipona bicolor]